MIKLSTGLRVAIAVGGDLKSSLDNGYVRIYSGAIPASADAALGSAVLLNEISAGGSGTPLTFESTAPGGVLVKSVAETWVGNNLGSGDPTFFRYVIAADTGNSSTTEIRFQGSVGPVGSDLVITELPLVSGQPQSFDSFSLVVPEQ